MRKHKGFTLVELLTVISIITILMAITIPVLSGVRRRAKAAVCLSNLRQWGMVYKMYTDEFDGKLPRDYDDSPWYYPISHYYSNERKILLCPAAKKPSSQNGTSQLSKYGGTFTAWKFLASEEEEVAWNSIGSYGLNGWAYKPERKNMFEDMDDTDIDDDEPDNSGSGNGGGGGGSGMSWWMNYWNKRFGTVYVSGNHSNSSDGIDVNGVNEEGLNNFNRYCLTAYEKPSNKIPLVFDSNWLYSYFNDNSNPPSKDDLSTRYSGRSNTTCMDRHDGGINMVFMDFSARKVGLKELWTLKWHKQFNTAGPWTKAGGVQPEAWPKWMQKYKDY